MMSLLIVLSQTARGLIGANTSSSIRRLDLQVRCIMMQRPDDQQVVVVPRPPRSVPARVAYELQKAGHRYLDVRTEGEFSAGHPDGAVNIPYLNKTTSGMMKNTHFLEQASRVFRKDDEIIVGCRSGKRSLMAAAELSAANGLPLNQ